MRVYPTSLPRKRASYVADNRDRHLYSGLHPGKWLWNTHPHWQNYGGLHWTLLRRAARRGVPPRHSWRLIEAHGVRMRRAEVAELLEDVQIADAVYEDSVEAFANSTVLEKVRLF